MTGRKKEVYTRFTRTGFVVKGIIYLLSGGLAVLKAADLGGRTLGRMGILRWLKGKPLDSILLLFIVLGLSGYVLLRIMQAVKDTNDKGNNWKGMLRRSGYFLSGLIYLFYVVFGAFLLFPESELFEEQNARTIRKALQESTLNLALVVAGVFTFSYGVLEIIRTFKASYQHNLSISELAAWKKSVIKTIASLGYVARGMLLCLVGFLLTKAAFAAYAQESGFTSQAYELLSSYLGKLFMGSLATGLVLYGIFMFVKARYYQISMH